MATPETKNFEIRPEEISPLTIEKKEVVSPLPSQFTKQVVSDGGKPLIQTPLNQTLSIKIPANQATLSNQAKGSIEDALTWFAAFWLRMIKKAIYFGWKVFVGD